MAGVSYVNLEAEGGTLPRVAMLSEEAWTANWRPRWPLATDNPREGCRRMSRAEALYRRHVECSPSALVSMLVIDVDHQDTLVRALQRPSHHPEVSWVAESPSGRGHVGWLLKTPVIRTDAARLAPMRYAAKVEEGLRRSLDGDVAFAGLLTKNPLHDDWVTHWGTDHLYALDELAQALGELMPRSLPRKAAESSGLGRNVALFNRLRLWAYRARLRYDDVAEWEGMTYDYARMVNKDFAVPLPLNEVGHTATSVARWVWRNFSVEKFGEIQAARGRRGGRKGGRSTSEAKREANRKRAQKIDLAALLTEARS